MWKVSRENSNDLGFSTTCLIYGTIDIEEFKLWLEIVITDMHIDDIPVFIFDLLGFRGSLFEIYNIIGFSPSSELSNIEEDAIIGITFLRGKKIYDSHITKKQALNALKKNKKIYEKFKIFFPFIMLPKV